MYANQWTWLLEKLGSTAHLDAAYMPRVNAGDVIDDDCNAGVALSVAILLASLEVMSTDVNRVVFGVVSPSDRDYMRCPIRPHRSDAG
jgi:hypothetical protein